MKDEVTTVRTSTLKQTGYSKNLCGVGGGSPP